MKGADEVIYVPVRDLVEESYTPNEGPSFGVKKVRPRKTRRHVEEPAADLFAGYDKFLVRTALIRADGVDMLSLPMMDDAESVANLCKHLRYADQEYLVTVALNGALRMLAIHEVAVGPSDAAATTAQHVLKVALLTSARGLIMVHNHPSGDPKPSEADAVMTRAVMQACECAGLSLFDHVIVADSGWLSFAGSPGGLAGGAENYSLTRFYTERWR